jgi:hypothetical protein
MIYIPNPPDISCHGVKVGTTAVPEIIDPVFTKTSQNARFLLSENERFGLVFVKTRSINSGTDIFCILALKETPPHPTHIGYSFSAGCG